MSGDGLVLVCRSCNVPLTRPLREMSSDEWRAEEWRAHTANAPLVDPGCVLSWSNELWNEMTMSLPFSSDCFVIEPGELVATGWIAGVTGCCGFPPLPPVNGRSPQNQYCPCGELIGWHNTDCLLPLYVALAPASVKPAT